MTQLRLTNLQDYTPSAEDHLLRFQYMLPLFVSVVLSGLVLLQVWFWPSAILGEGSGLGAGEIIVGIIIGVGLVFLFSYAAYSTWQRASVTRHPNAWSLSFGPDALALNLRHPLDLTTQDPQDETVAIIPRDQIKGIRRTTQKIRDADETNPEYVEFALSTPEWEKIFAAYKIEFHRVGALGREEFDHHILFYKNASTRVRIDGDRWRQSIPATWERLGYPVAGDHIVTGPDSMAEAAQQPKRVLPI